MKIIFRQLIILYILFFSPNISEAQEYYPKREFRGVWMASLNNIDWPSVQGLTSEEQQEEFRNLLSVHRENGLNAVFVQIRPSADALYESPYEPWSRWLTGIEGKEPNPFYDPLRFMIKECHQQGMEFHAWINPFRAISDFKKVKVDSSHIFYKNPEWMLTYEKDVYLDPGMSQVRAYVLDVIMDIVNRYDVDGIHFDDYFCPYLLDSIEFPDETTFKLYGEDFDEKDDWRRNNINLFIQSVHDSIQAVKPEVKFGISPFRVYQMHEREVADTLSLAGLSGNEDLFVDVIAWLQNGWVDYIVPMLHFGAEDLPADYQALLSRWSQNTYGKQLYIGQVAEHVSRDKNLLAQNLSSVPGQFRTNLENYQVDGTIFFSARASGNIPEERRVYGAHNHYPYKALVPAMTWKPGQAPDPPSNLKFARKKNEVLIQWESNIHQPTRYYVVYLQEGDTPPNISNGKYILGKTNDRHFSFTEKGSGPFRKRYCLVVTAVDQQHRESSPSQPIMIRLHYE